MSMTPAERAAWDAIGHNETHWGAVKRALKAAAPIIRDRAALNIASILDDYGMTEAAAEVRAMPAQEAAIQAEMGPTPCQSKALEALKGLEGPATARVVGNRLGISPRAAASRLYALRSLGLVQMVRHGDIGLVYRAVSR